MLSPAAQAMNHVVNRYPIGSKVKVYYDPAKPSSSVLESGSPAGFVVFLAIMSIAALIGAIICAFAAAS